MTIYPNLKNSFIHNNFSPISLILCCILIFISIKGNDGCVVIDTLEGEAVAKEVLDKMEKEGIITQEKPIKAIIITHFHFDHSNGMGYFRKKYPNAKVS